MRSAVRWFVPVAVAATIAGGVAVSSAQAGNTPDLPQRTPQQVLASVAGSSVTALSGTVVTRADLGIPSLSGILSSAPSATTDPTGLITRFLTGENTVRVWLDGEQHQRAQLLDPFSELDVIRNGTDLWTYTSRGNQVQHGTMTPQSASQHPGKISAKAPMTMPADLTPAQAADRAIAAAGPTTAVTLGTPTVVAGQSTYTLTLTPKTDATLVGRIVVAVDAQNGVPLQLQVFARGSTQPALETGFTAIDFSTPAASIFSFTPPQGATVTPLDTPKPGTGTPAPSSAADRPKVIGTGWTSIVEFPAGTAQGALSGSSTVTTPGAGSGGSTSSSLAAIGQVLTPVAGGRGLSTTLLSVLVTTDGRVLVGAVPMQALSAAAAQ